MSSKRGPKMREPSYEQVLKFIQRNNCPFVTTRDVHARFDTVTERTVRARLHDLVEQNQLKSRKVGGSNVWYLPNYSSASDSSRSPSSLNQ